MHLSLPRTLPAALGLSLLLMVPSQGNARTRKGYYDLLMQKCERSGRSVGCCKASVRHMRSGGYRLKSGRCPAGTKRNGLRCRSSFQWCVPPKGRAAHPGNKKPKKKKRIRIFQTDLTIGASGKVRQDAGKVDTGGPTQASHSFRIKLEPLESSSEPLERGRKGCRKGDPMGRVNNIVAKLDGEVAAELREQTGGCWSKHKSYLLSNRRVHGARLVIEGRGTEGGLVRAWLDAYPRAKQETTTLLGIKLPKFKRKKKKMHTLLRQVPILIGPDGKVSEHIGPFHLPDPGPARVKYFVKIRLIKLGGPACNSADEVVPPVRRIEVKLNGKNMGPYKFTSHCGETLHHQIKPQTTGNNVEVNGFGEPGGKFSVGFTYRVR